MVKITKGDIEIYNSCDTKDDCNHYCDNNREYMCGAIQNLRNRKIIRTLWPGCKSMKDVMENHIFRPM